MKKKLILILGLFIWLISAKISAEYVFYLEGPDGKMAPIPASDHEKIYTILLDYQFPMCICNETLPSKILPIYKRYFYYPEEKLIRNQIETFQRKGQLSPNLRFFYMPKTLYEMHFFLSFLRTIESHTKRDLEAQKPFPFATKSDIPPLPTYKNWCEEAKLPLVIAYHLALNNEIVNYMQLPPQTGYEAGMLAKLGPEIQQKINNLLLLDLAIVKFKELKKGMPESDAAGIIERIHSCTPKPYLAKLDKLIEQALEGFPINALLQNLPDTSFANKALRGIRHFNSNLAQLQQCVKIEIEAHKCGNWVLYRGGKLGPDDFEPITKPAWPIPLPLSLSFGNSLFAGLIYESEEKGAMAYRYISMRGGYALLIDMKGYLLDELPRKLFFITPFPTILSFYLWGENFHPRSKVFASPDMPIAGIKYHSYNWPEEYIRADRNFFTDKEEFERTMKQYFGKNIGIKISKQISW